VWKLSTRTYWLALNQHINREASLYRMFFLRIRCKQSGLGWQKAQKSRPEAAF
jgi:hypothetical protein